MSDLDILLTEPERRPSASAGTCAVVAGRCDFYHAILAVVDAQYCDSRLALPLSVWCLPSAVKLSEAFA